MQRQSGNVGVWIFGAITVKPTNIPPIHEDLEGDFSFFVAGPLLVERFFFLILAVTTFFCLSCGGSSSLFTLHGTSQVPTEMPTPTEHIEELKA